MQNEKLNEGYNLIDVLTKISLSAIFCITLILNFFIRKILGSLLGRHSIKQNGSFLYLLSLSNHKPYRRLACQSYTNFSWIAFNLKCSSEHFSHGQMMKMKELAVLITVIFSSFLMSGLKEEWYFYSGKISILLKLF